MPGPEGERPRGNLTVQNTTTPATERAGGTPPAPLNDAFEKLRETPPTEDPAFWPVRVLNELNYMILNREYVAPNTPNAWGVSARDVGERFAPFQEHIRKVKTAYEILAYPHCKSAGSREVIEGELARDQHAFERDKVYICNRICKELEERPSEALGHQIAATSVDAAGRDHFRYRLDLQYEDSGGILVRIAKGALDGADGASTRSIANICNANKVALDFLKREFADDAGALRAFYGYLINKVKLIRIQTQHVAKALKIFETIIDRGVSLDSMDLLKNLLFMKASRDAFEKLKTHWKELQDIIFDMGKSPCDSFVTLSSVATMLISCVRTRFTAGLRRTRSSAAMPPIPWALPRSS